jgi:hypothetical protein
VIISLETCRAVKEEGSNKLSNTVASCWSFYKHCIMIQGTRNVKNIPKLFYYKWWHFHSEPVHIAWANLLDFAGSVSCPMYRIFIFYYELWHFHSEPVQIAWANLLDFARSVSCPMYRIFIFCYKLWHFHSEPVQIAWANLLDFAGSVSCPMYRIFIAPQS